MREEEEETNGHKRNRQQAELTNDSNLDKTNRKPFNPHRNNMSKNQKCKKNSQLKLSL